MIRKLFNNGKNQTTFALGAVFLAVICNIILATQGINNSFVVSLAFLLLVSSLYRLNSSSVATWARVFGVVSVIFGVLPWIGLSRLDYLDVATQIALFATLAMGLNLVVGMVGLLDLGFIAFFAVGAYTWAILGSSQLSEIWIGFAGLPGWSFFLVLPCAAALAGGVGVLLGLPVLRVKGDYLALVTLGFGEVIRVLLNNLDKPINLTGGPRGIPSIHQPFAELATTVAQWSGIENYRLQALAYYLLTVLIAFAAAWVFNRISRSPIGWAWEAIREDEIAAQAMGIPRIRMKLLAFALGASVSGMMGVVFAAKQTFISPDSFDFNQSIGILAMVVLGGVGSLRGVVLGAAVMVILNVQVLKGFSSTLAALKASGASFMGSSFTNWPPELEPSKYERLLFGLLVWWMMIYRPEGLLPAKRPIFIRDDNHVA
ncbi:MAG: branched-chain amino acid ABC transporter permease [Pseudomonadota bacterium]